MGLSPEQPVIVAASDLEQAHVLATRLRYSVKTISVHQGEGGPVATPL